MNDEIEQVEGPSDEWAMVEVFGHRSHSGRIQEVERFGAKMLRIDVPISDTEFETHLYGGSSIFSLTPCTESAARKANSWRISRAPVALLDAPDDDDDVEF